jgi:DNA repair exonuclease SbcCD ATPase subunit
VIPKRIELENFLSFGKPAVEFSFTDDEPLWALCGRNGVGKSAVFDAITYALYGEHRGGTQKAERLIRHDANAFRIVFEFEFAGVDYRITRARSGRTSQKAERRVDGEWEAIPGLNSAADVKAWVERTVGLGYKAFITSVMLRQGEADKLFSASRDERIAVLKGIIGFEQFEELSERIHSATICEGNALETARRRLDGLLPVAQEQLRAAEDAVTAADRKREQTQRTVAAAIQRVEQAKQWKGLETKRARLEKELDAAKKRAEDAKNIQADKARLDDLDMAVPELKALVALRDHVRHLEPMLSEAQSATAEIEREIVALLKCKEQAGHRENLHKEQAAELERLALSLSDEIERGTNFVQLAEAMQDLRNRLATFPDDLADQVSQAEADENIAELRKQQSSDSLAGAMAVLERVKAQRDGFAKVKVGVTCSRCGQIVDEVHAAKERARLTDEIEASEANLAQLNESFAAADATYSSARQRRVLLENRKADHDLCNAQLATTNANLSQLNAGGDPAQLRARLAEQREEMGRGVDRGMRERFKQNEAKLEADRLGREHQQLDSKLLVARNTVRELERRLATDHAESTFRLDRLGSDWRARLPHLNEEAVREIAAERDRLQASGVADRFESLRQDHEACIEWSKQLHEVRSESDAIPADARIPLQDAERGQDEAKTSANLAIDHRDVAVRTRDVLEARMEEHGKLTAQLRKAERSQSVHKKLDELLGQSGLQRELVRHAEQRVVALANETLQHLSDGELTLEQDDEAEGREDKAFALRVRRPGDPLPIGVLFLSGSQKFRVAVSVALAVGRFASGRARPLQAVIIDEGFGSLDKDGLRAMADELKRLQRTQALKRVILVSHQEEFTDQFPVGYKLSPGPNGTTSSPFRR